MYFPKSAETKVTPSMSKMGGGGSRPLLDNVQKEAFFGGGLLPLDQNVRWLQGWELYVLTISDCVNGLA